MSKHPRMITVSFTPRHAEDDPKLLGQAMALFNGALPAVHNERQGDHSSEEPKVERRVAQEQLEAKALKEAEEVLDHNEATASQAEIAMPWPPPPEEIPKRRLFRLILLQRQVVDLISAGWRVLAKAALTVRK
jgi:hypothetical protein